MTRILLTPMDDGINKYDALLAALNTCIEILIEQQSPLEQRIAEAMPKLQEARDRSVLYMSSRSPPPPTLPGRPIDDITASDIESRPLAKEW